MEGAGVATYHVPGYNRSMKETKSKRFNMWMKPSVKVLLARMAEVLRDSESEIVEKSLLSYAKQKDVRDALAKAPKEGS